VQKNVQRVQSSLKVFAEKLRQDIKDIQSIINHLGRFPVYNWAAFSTGLLDFYFPCSGHEKLVEQAATGER